MNVPNHIAIILDGNGRWAKSRFLPRTAGHKAGVEAIREVIKESQRLGVKHLTLYAFSTENWKRPKLEVDTLMTLLATYLSKEIKELHANNVKVTTIGDISKLPKNCIEQLNNAFELTKDNTGVNLIFIIKAIIPGKKVIKVNGVKALCASLKVFALLAIAIHNPLINKEYATIIIDTKI